MMADLNIRTYGAKPDAPEATLKALKIAYKNAKDGDTIHIPEGTYEIPVGVHKIGASGTLTKSDGGAVLWAKGETQFICQDKTSVSLLNIDLRNINLWMIRLKGLVIDVVNMTTAQNPNDLIRLAFCDNFEIKNMNFHRDITGRTIALAHSNNGEVAYCTATGSLKTGLNISGNIDNKSFIEAKHCNFIRTVPMNEVPSNDEDHGMYFQTAGGIHIRNCVVKGWSNTSSGGSLKLRNSDKVQIIDNTFLDSGIILPSYPNVPQYPHLTDIVIRGNLMDVGKGFVNTDAAIVFWRHLADEYPTGIKEENILISHNTIRGYKPKFHLQKMFSQGITKEMNNFIHKGA